MSCLLPRAKLQRVTFFMKRSYLLPRENFKLPHLPNQAHWDPGFCSQLRSSHIHSIHQKSRDFIYGNFVYLALICAVWSSRGRTGKKVTAVTFFRCPTVSSNSPITISLWHTCVPQLGRGTSIKSYPLTRIVMNQWPWHMRSTTRHFQMIYWVSNLRGVHSSCQQLIDAGQS